MSSDDDSALDCLSPTSQINCCTWHAEDLMLFAVFMSSTVLCFDRACALTRSSLRFSTSTSHRAKAPLLVRPRAHPGAPTIVESPLGGDLDVVPEKQWRADAAAHELRVRCLVGGHLHKFDSSNPIYNFLFKYYFWKPAVVASYSPGWNRVLLGAQPDEVTHGGGQRAASVLTSGGRDGADGLFFDGSRCSPETLVGLQNTLDLLRATEQRPPVLNCFGMHEWAMLYSLAPNNGGGGGGGNAKHQRLPLRLSQVALDAAVEERAPLKCTHFDAFRFYTPKAVSCRVCAFSYLSTLSCYSVVSDKRTLMFPVVNRSELSFVSLSLSLSHTRFPTTTTTTTT